MRLLVDIKNILFGRDGGHVGGSSISIRVELTGRPIIFITSTSPPFSCSSGAFNSMRDAPVITATETVVDGVVARALKVR